MNTKTITILLFFVLVVNFTGLFGVIFNVDSTLYAVISKSFSLTNDYLNIYVNGVDWLDKPHFPFWVSALSINIFGVTSFAYKLPSFLFFVLGLYYTFKLTQQLYDKQTAYIAVLLLGSSLHIVIANNDVRAEAILLGLIMGAVYYMYLLVNQYSIKNILLVSIFSAAAVMTKGIFVLIIVYSAVFLNLLVKKEYSKIIQPKWIIVGLLTLVFIFPELYAVYQQFDLHPEKTVFDRQNVSGLQFFIWDSQFGRFFNSGPIKGYGDKWFFFHTTLWAFAPWAILSFLALFQTTKKLINKDKNQEYITYFGFMVMFIIFSISKFQLSHYTNIIFPFIAIMVARLFTNSVQTDLVKGFVKYSILTYTLLFIGMIVLIELVFKTDYPAIGWTILVLILISTFLIILKSKQSREYQFLSIGICSCLFFTLYFNLSFYPSLLKYQSGSEMAFYLEKNHPKIPVKVTYNDWALQYYSHNELVFIKNQKQLNINDLLFTDADFLKILKENNQKFTIIKSLDNFHITLLNKTFFDSKTRKEATTERFLIQIQ